MTDTSGKDYTFICCQVAGCNNDGFQELLICDDHVEALQRPAADLSANYGVPGER